MLILQSGVQSLIVDTGRKNAQHLGFCQTGALDTISYRLANTLVGNDASEYHKQSFPCIEILMGQFGFECLFDSLIAITGAKTKIMINRQLADLNRPYLVKKGDVVEISTPTQGARNYLAINAMITSAQHFGSKSVALNEGTGGTQNNGLGLTRGEQIKFSRLPNKHKNTSLLMTYNKQKDRITQFTSKLNSLVLSIHITVLRTYQHADFSRMAHVTFYNNKYRVTQNANRMGLRLQGPTIDSKGPVASLLSEAIAYGAVQVPPDGQPIILLKERQTIGGYPKIATVCGASLSALAQCLPNVSIEFIQTDIYSARNENLLLERLFDALQKTLDSE